jgi:hypothetical protein
MRESASESWHLFGRILRILFAPVVGIALFIALVLGAALFEEKIFRTARIEEFLIERRLDGPFRAAARLIRL